MEGIIKVYSKTLSAPSQALKCIISYKKDKSFFSILLFSLVLPVNSLAAPSGGNIVGGSGSIQQSGLTTTINQNSNSLAIDWNSFNINQNETVNFLQPGASSIALNRILGNNASQIYGQINANGRVMLVNPNGLFFSPTATVNVGGLIASGLDISPASFMNGDYIFNEVLGTDGTIINSGLINASLGGSVTLLGKQVRNEGVISAQLGSVNLAAGKGAVLTFDNEGLMGVKVTSEVLQEELGVEAAVLNDGDINAQGGRVLLTASQSQDVFSQAVNHVGIQQATSVVVHEDGSFTLGSGADTVNHGVIDVSASDGDAGHVVMLGENVTSSGQIKADSVNANGGEVELHASDKTILNGNSLISVSSATNDAGTVKILGDKVGLFDQSKVEASGYQDGGDILIGGDYKGENENIRNSSISYVDEDVLIEANSTFSGDGGRVIQWADNTARYYGTIQAQGGVNSGDGGFVEISGKEYLDFNGHVNLYAVSGVTGTLLLDPRNITIRNGVSDPVSSNDAFTDNSSGDVVFDADSITDILTGSNGASLADVVLQANADIWVDEAIDISLETGNTQSLTLQAGDDIEIDADIKLVGGTLTLSQGDSGCSPCYVDSGIDVIEQGDSGDKVLDIDANLSTVGGNIVLGSGVDATKLIRIGNGSDTINISTGAGAGDVDFNTEIYGGGANNILNIEAGTGEVTFYSSAGTSTSYLGELNITSASVANLNAVNTGNNINIQATAINLNGDIRSDRDTNGGDISLSGTVILNSNVRFDAERGTDGEITVTGTIDDDADIDNVYRTLEFRSGSKNTTISQNVGGQKELQQFFITNSATSSIKAINTRESGVSITATTGIDLGGDINTSFGTNGGNVDINGAVTLSSDVSINTSTSGTDGSVDFDTTINSDDVSTLRSLTIDSGINNTSIGGVIGGITDLQGLSINNAGTITLNEVNTDSDGVKANGNILNLNGNIDTNNGLVDLDSVSNLQLTNSISTSGGDVFINVTDTSSGYFRNDSRDTASISTGSGNVSIAAAGNDGGNNRGVRLGSITTTGSGILTVTSSNGRIVQSSDADRALNIAGTSSFDSGTDSTTLNNTVNDFTGAVSLVASTAEIVDTNDIELGTVNITGTGNALSVTVLNNGDISQSAGTTISANTAGAVTSLTAIGNAVNLNDGGSATTNDFNQIAVSASSTSIADTNAIQLNAFDITGTDATTLTVVAGGAVTQGGVLDNNGNNAMTFIDASGQSVVLTNSSNDFNHFSVNALNADIVDVNSIAIGNSTITDINGTAFKVTASGVLGSISQVASSAVSVNNTGAITELVAIGDDASLDQSNNDFTQINISAASSTIQDVDDIALGAITLSGSGGITFDLTAGGAVTQAGSETILNSNAGAITRVTATGQTIDLINNANDFSIVQLAGFNVDVHDLGSIELDTSTVTGTLGVTSLGSGDITQSGAVSVSGLTTLVASGDDITLTNNLNDFSAVNFNGATNVDIHDTNSIILNAATGINSLDVTTYGTGSSTLGITQAGALGINGSSSFNATGGVITLTQGNSFGGSVSLNNSGNNNVAITNNGLLTFTDSNLGSGELSVTNTTGNIVQTGAITQETGGTLVSFDAGSNAITLDNIGNDFVGSVSLTASQAAISDSNSLQLGDSTVSNGLTITALNGNITQLATGTGLNITGTADFTSTNGYIDLTNNTNNDFQGDVSLVTTGTEATNTTVQITDVNDIALTNVNVGASTADFVVNATQVNLNGDVTTSGGSATFNAPVVLQSNAVASTPTMNTINTGAGVINFNNSIEGTHVGEQSLTLVAGDVNFRGNVGGATRLGAVNMTATGDVTAQTTDVVPVLTNISASSLNVASSNSFTAGVIDTSGVADGDHGGSVAINADSAISITSIDTRGAALPAGVGGNGGDIVLSVDNGVAPNSVELNGDIITSGGSGTTPGSAGSATVNLNGTGDGSFTITSAPLTSGLTVNGNGSADTFNAADTTNAWEIDGNNNGSLNTNIIFTGFENLTGNNGADTFDFIGAGTISGLLDGGTGVDIIDLSTAGTVTKVQLGATSGMSDSSTLEVTRIENIIANVANANELIGENIDSNWYINGPGSGSIGGDTLTTLPVENRVVFSGFNKLTGGANTDTLTGPDVNTTWTVDSVNGGKLVNSSDVTEVFIEFEGMENLQGGTQDDTFAFLNGSDVTGTVDGGAHTDGDTIDFSALTTVTFNMSSGFSTSRTNFEQVSGNGVDSTIIGDNTLNIWSIDGQNTGTIGVLRFIDFNNLNGGNVQDVFNFATDTANITGLIDGGGSSTSADTIDLTAITDLNSITVQLESNAGATSPEKLIINNNNILDVINIGQINANSNSGNTLLGGEIVNTWTISDDRIGNINSTGFSGFSILTGAGDDDTFTITTSSITDSMTLNGGDGTDSFNRLSGANNWLLSSDNNGTLNSTINFTGIENLNGNTGTLTGPSVSDNTWAMTGNSAGNLNGNLIFSGMSTITGGTTNDIFNLAESITAGSFNGGTGTDTINRLAGANNWLLSTDNNGTLNSTINFTGIENLNGNTGTLTGPSVLDNTWTVTSNAAGNLNGNLSFSGMGTITGGTTNDIFNLAAGITTGTFNGGTGNDTINRLAGANNWLLSTDNAGTLNASINFSEIENLNGNNGNLTGPSVSDNTWTMTGNAAGNLNGNLSFSGMGTITGGTTNDIFNLAAGITTGTFNGGIGSDTIERLTGANTWLLTTDNNGTLNSTINFNGIENLNGNNGNLTGPSPLLSDNTWTMTANAVGNLNGNLSFTGMGTITGGTTNDIFNLAESITAGSFNGGTGTDTINRLTGANDWLLSADNNGTLNSTINFNGIENLNGNNGTLTGPSVANNIWTMTSDYAGNLNANMSFTGMGTIIGGTLNDRFNIAATVANGIFNGGAGGIDIIALGAGSDSDINTWDITGDGEGTLKSSIQFALIDELIGNEGVDQFTLSTDQFNGHIDGAAGIDSITAGLAGSTWSINQSDGGTVTLGASGNTASYSSTENLVGSSGNDTFNVSATGEVSGTIDGNTGIDTINLINKGQSVNVKLGAAMVSNVAGLTAAGDFNASNVETVDAPVPTASISNTITGADIDRFWIISDINSGAVGPEILFDTGIPAGDTEGITKFSNFDKVEGGSQDDSFRFIDNGEITTSLVGGDENIGDTIDFSQQSEVRITIGSGGSTEYDQVEGIRGNNVNSTLIASNTDNEWTISGHNDGTVVNTTADPDSSFTFFDFNILIGGDQVDNFVMNPGGSVEDQAGNSNPLTGIYGGAGADSLTITLNGMDDGRVALFDGGDGVDTITFQDSSSSSGFDRAVFSPEITNDLVTYSFDNLDLNNVVENSYAVIYKNAETISDQVSADKLVINGTTVNDNIQLSSTDFAVASIAPVIDFGTVSYSNKNNIDVIAAGGSNDTVILQSNIDMAGHNLLLSAETIENPTNRLITATTLALNSVQNTTETLRTDIDILDISNSATVLPDRIIIDELDDIQIARLDLTGMLSLSAGGNITQSSSISSSSALVFTSRNGDVLLNNSLNALSGALSLTAVNNIELANDEVTDLASIQAANLRVNSTNNINDSGNILVANAVLDAGAGSIILDSTGNDFDFISISSAENVVISDMDDIQLGDINMGSAAGTGTFVLNSTGVSQQAGTRFNQVQPAAGLAGQVTFNAGAGSILLDQNNQFAGPVSLNNSGNNAVEITDIDNIVFSTSNIGSGTFTVNASSGVTQSAAITQQNNAGVVVINAGAGEIDFSETGNNFSGSISLNNSGSNAVSLANANDIDLDGVVTGGSLDVVASGNFDITQSSALNVAGDASFSANAGQSIVLNDAANNFQQAVTIQANSGGALQEVQVTDNSALNLAALNVSNLLNITANGDVTGSGGWTVDGITSIDSTGNAVMLEEPANNFNEIVFVNASNVSLVDSNDVILGTATQSNMISGGLSVTSLTGSITDNNASSLTVAGTTTLNAGSGIGDVILDSAMNNFSSVNILSAQNVTLTDSDSIEIESTAINGDLNVTALNSINDGDSGLSVFGASTLSAGAGESIILNNVANQLNGPLSFSASSGGLRDVQVVNTVATTLDTVEVTNNLTITSAGEITQNGSFVVGNSTTLSSVNNAAVNQDISLGSFDNNLNNLSVEQGHDVTINNASNALTISQLNATGRVDITSGILNVLNNLSGAGITIDAASGQANFAADIDSTSEITITANGIALNGEVNAVNDIVLDALSGDTIINEIITASSGEISIEGNNIIQNGSISSSTGAVTMDGATSLALNAAINAQQSVTLSTQSGSISQNTNLSSIQGDITLNSGQDIIMNSQASAVTSSGDIQYTAENNQQLGLLSAQGNGVIIVSNNGRVSDNNAGSVNVVSELLNVRSDSGIGQDGNALDTQVAVVDMINSGDGSIYVQQTGDVEIINLQTNFDGKEIDFRSDQDVSLNPGSVAVSRDSGTVFMSTATGSFFGLQNFDLNNADITANNATFFALSGTFGSTGRPIVMDVPKNGSVFIDARTTSIRFFPETPDNLITTGIDISSLGVISAIAGEQLVEIESLGDIDPAIFTELRNYSLEEISIRLPQDQLFEDELEEAEKEKLSQAF